MLIRTDHHHHYLCNIRTLYTAGISRSFEGRRKSRTQGHRHCWMWCKKNRRGFVVWLLKDYVSQWEWDVVAVVDFVIGCTMAADEEREVGELYTERGGGWCGRASVGRSMKWWSRAGRSKRG